jgi:drug/metabolite transporter (DMT)-like permease
MVFLIGTLAAVSLGLGYVLQQRVAATMPLEELLSFRLLLDLMHRPVWWGGIGAMVVGQLLGGYALQMASVGQVEPLLSASLLFALAFANLMSQHRICWQELSGAVLLSAALGVFIAVGNPHSSPTPDPNPYVIVAAVCAVIGAVGVLVGIGKTRGLVGESVLLAVGAGLLYGLQDTATRAALVDVNHHGITGMLVHPWPYIVVGAAIIGLLLSQSAFKAARLDYSLPPVAAAEPLTGIALGVTLLGDVVSVSPGALAVEALCVVAMIFGVALIGRSPSLAGHHLLRHRHMPLHVSAPHVRTTYRIATPDDQHAARSRDQA